ncbi:unnamed protein product [Cryptosporidium hominis]|uniref:Uncharacterized protein n=1 Tax=Cryptosporidium hominis TaxID=237895 RepID=A0A0S4TJZ3_CRYHO|nr:hypothetical protein [Cryptosporidium hominis TU502]OLQ17911.1 hypothetical protein ChTU502y2012_407g1195 [Cryptosporidium hominis]PPA64129.1 hypothetical protein ChUKH1_04955 [Cryptosporidium hominis]PPS94912.1 Uncharacterized protein GY17_00002037 [Cryptosporidium hominis]CUV07225.1 unnamed protein product [Cryptosporidium hominis]|eukprot:PPS94912.1 Uncharacterized protein GY17_00002037 [Cryptosporidium hominis]
MNLNQEQIDIRFGKLILEQYKIRKELGLLFNQNFSNVDLICSKYKEKYWIPDEFLEIKFQENNDDHIAKEFERVLQELQRREELIHELLAKIEKYESTPKESRSSSASYFSELADTNSGFAKTSEKIELESMVVLENSKDRRLFQWRSIINEMINSKYTKYSECPSNKDNGVNIKCRHERLVSLYKNELATLYKEVEKLKIGSKLH